MKTRNNPGSNWIFISILFLLPLISVGQTHSLIGYWHNWQDANAPYIRLDSVDTRYDIIEVSFAVPTSPSDMNMVFSPDQYSQSQFISQIQNLQSHGKKVLISIGGATTSIDLTSSANKNAFITTMTGIINTYNFDGMDLDIENGNSILVLGGGTIAASNDVAILNLIDAVKQIMVNYRLTHNHKLMLTMAPETAYVQGGQSAYGSIWGGYLPTIHALRDSLDILQVQLYNSGSMYGIDGNTYTQGTADFIIAMCEAVIHGFSTSGGSFIGLPSNKVAIGLPACTSAAGGGYVDSATVVAAVKYLMGAGPKPGTYTLSNSSGYPSLRGMMTWSINWDAVSTCGNKYGYANTYQSIFGTSTSTQQIKEQEGVSIYPNPTSQTLHIQLANKNTLLKTIRIFNVMGVMVHSESTIQNQLEIDISELANGLYTVDCGLNRLTFIKY